MSDFTADTGLTAGPLSRPHMDQKPHAIGAIAFIGVLGRRAALRGLQHRHRHVAMWGSTTWPSATLVLLGLALLIALGFEFVNGFHDTANAVATVIYTHSLPPLVAVVWSGTFNLLGVLWSSGAVAFTVVTLLPVELILQVGSGAGYAMIFALLIAAIIWNLGTWAFGIPNSSSHALIGSIMGVGLANQFMAPAGSATSGVDWGQAVRRVQGAAVQPGDRASCCPPLLLLGDEAGGAQQVALHRAGGQQAAAAADPRPAGAHLHAASRSSTAAMTGRRAWA